MTDQLPIIPAAARVEDVCDHCARAFARVAGGSTICPSCGLPNVRRTPAPRESTMLAPAAEQAVPPKIKPRQPARKKRA